MTSTNHFTTFTSTGTRANQQLNKTTKVRDDFRVIFTDKVRYHKDKVWDRDHEGAINIGKEGGRMYTMVNDHERMVGAPRKIFSSEDEYIRWYRDRVIFQEVEDVDIEEDEPEIEDLNSELIRD